MINDRDYGPEILYPEHELIEKYSEAARVIKLYLVEFCDKTLPYDEMIADAARKASSRLEEYVTLNGRLGNRILHLQAEVAKMQGVVDAAQKNG